MPDPSNVIPISREAAEAQLRRALAILKEEPPLTWKDEHQKAMDELSAPSAGVNGEWDDQF